MKLYNTVMKEASAEQIIERSRFIAHVKPVSSREEADYFISQIKKEYRDATHNVPAMVIGDKMQIQWASDDGEPQGTSGAPIIKMITAAEITDVAVVVTRYFGGIKLGTGGLARAYTSSARLGIDAAGLCRVENRLCLTVEFDYTYLAKIKSMEGSFFNISDIRYAEKVEADIICEPEKKEETEAFLADFTGGRFKIKDEKISKVKINL